MLQSALILAGGFGTRLQSIVNDVPKPMAPILNKPFLQYQIRYLKHFGIKKIIFSVGYLHQIIENYFGKHFLGIDISYVLEEEPLGTGGGIRLALNACTDEDVLVLNGDSFFDCDLLSLYQFHQKNHSPISLALRQVDNASRFGTIETNPQHKIISFKEKNNNKHLGIINAGIYILNKSIFLQNTPVNVPFSIEKDFFEKNLNKFNMMGYLSDGYFIDIGLPEDFIKAQDDFKEFKY